MTTQTILTFSAIATVTVFSFCFAVDLASILLQAWRAAAPAPHPESQPEREPIPQPVYASLDWVKSEEVHDTTEDINIIELAKARLPMPKPQPVITTLPQTPEAAALYEWLSVVPSPYFTPRPDYSTLASMTVKKLRQEAKIRNVRNASAMAKKDLIAALLAA